MSEGASISLWPLTLGCLVSDILTREVPLSILWPLGLLTSAPHNPCMAAQPQEAWGSLPGQGDCRFPPLIQAQLQLPGPLPPTLRCPHPLGQHLGIYQQWPDPLQAQLRQGERKKSLPRSHTTGGHQEAHGCGGSRPGAETRLWWLLAVFGLQAALSLREAGGCLPRELHVSTAGTSPKDTTCSWALKSAHS